MIDIYPQTYLMILFDLAPLSRGLDPELYRAGEDKYKMNILMINGYAGNVKQHS